MKRMVLVAGILALSACAAPSSTVDTNPDGQLPYSVASTDTAAVRKLCIAPDSVLSGKKPCVLRADYAGVRKF